MNISKGYDPFYTAITQSNPGGIVGLSVKEKYHHEEHEGLKE
jgi:hypothetical protein